MNVSTAKKFQMFCAAMVALAGAGTAQANAANAAYPVAASTASESPDTVMTQSEARAEAARERVAITPTTLIAQIRAKADSGFRALFGALRHMDGDRAMTALSIPLRRPVDTVRLSSSYGLRVHPVLGKIMRHNGLDLPNPTGTPIYATADGQVERAGWAGGYGNLVQLGHGNGIETRYGHMSRLAVAAGQFVKAGQIIGFVGSTGRSTGPHLHYEVRIAGEPVNPTPFIGSDIQLAANGGMGGPDSE